MCGTIRKNNNKQTKRAILTAQLKIIKDFILHTYETYLNMRNKGYYDLSLLLNIYEISGTCLQINNNIYFDEELALKLRTKIDAFWHECIVLKNLEPDSAKKLKHSFDNWIQKYLNDIIYMETVMNDFIKREYNITEEELIREAHKVMDFDKGCFAIDATYFE